MKFTRRALCAAFAAAAALPALAACFPDKPVKIAVGFAAGGGADIIARQVGAQMGAQVGQSFVVENKAGATGTIAATFVARSPADGYTVFLGVAESARLSDFEVLTWYGLFAPAGTSQQFTELMKAQVPRMDKLIRAASIRAD